MSLKVKAITVTLLSLGVPAEARSQIPSWVDYPHEARAAFVESFSGLGRVDTSAGTLLYPSGSEVINRSRSELPQFHPLYGDPADFFASSGIVLARIPAEAVGAESDRYVVYTEAPSFDPGFYLIVEGSGDEPVKMSGEVLAIVDDDHLYTFGRINRSCPTRRTWTLRDGRVQEVQQPFYWVGLSSTTLVPVTLFAGPTDDGVVGDLAEGVPIEVVLTDDVGRAGGVYSFLVRTESGVMGWVRVTMSALSATVLAAIFWLGD